MLETPRTLPSDPDELRAVAQQLRDLARSQALKIEKLERQLAGHRKARFGSRSESLDQLAFDLSEDREIAAAAVAMQEETGRGDDQVDDDTPGKRKHSRAPLPDHLERRPEVLSPGETCAGCGGTLRTLGEDGEARARHRSEGRAERETGLHPGRFVVRDIIRPRMTCAGCEAFAQAPPPSRPITRGRAGPGLLAHVLAGKYCDHLPLHRQSGICVREKVDLHRSTLSGWVGRSTALLEPLADHIGRQVVAGHIRFANDTPVKMQTGGKTGRTQTARMWSCVRDERPWCGQAPPCA